MADTISDGPLLAIPAGSANGTRLTGRPIRSQASNGVVLYLAAGESVSFTIAVTAPTAPPSNVITVSGDDYGQWPELLGRATSVFITAKTGSPRFRWF